MGSEMVSILSKITQLMSGDVSSGNPRSWSPPNATCLGMCAKAEGCFPPQSFWFGGSGLVPKNCHFSPAPGGRHAAVRNLTLETLF